MRHFHTIQLFTHCCLPSPLTEYLKSWPLTEYLKSRWRVFPWFFRKYTTKTPQLRNNTYTGQFQRLTAKRQMWSVSILFPQLSLLYHVKLKWTPAAHKIGCQFTFQPVLKTTCCITRWYSGLNIICGQITQGQTKAGNEIFNRSGCPCGTPLCRMVLSFHLAVTVSFP